MDSDYDRSGHSRKNQSMPERTLLRKSLLITYLTIYSWKISALTRLRVSGVINR